MCVYWINFNCQISKSFVHNRCLFLPFSLSCFSSLWQWYLDTKIWEPGIELGAEIQQRLIKHWHYLHRASRQEWCHISSTHSSNMLCTRFVLKVNESHFYLPLRVSFSHEFISMVTEVHDFYSFMLWTQWILSATEGEGLMWTDAVLAVSSHGSHPGSAPHH